MVTYLRGGGDQREIVSHTDERNGALFNYFGFICNYNNTFSNPYNCGQPLNCTRFLANRREFHKALIDCFGLFFQVLGLIAFALVLSHDLSSIFSHYGFFIVVSGLCWIGAFLIILFHMCGCCKVNILGVWQKEYSLVSTFSVSFSTLKSVVSP